MFDSEPRSQSEAQQLLEEYRGWKAELVGMRDADYSDHVSGRSRTEEIAMIDAEIARLEADLERRPW